jgi:RNA polymerase sigma factor (sigma-70 family)
MQTLHIEPRDVLASGQDSAPQKPRSNRRNYWCNRNPEDFVNYPKLEPLPYLKESHLIRAAQAGDIDARNEVWMHYARLVLSVINEFHVPEHLLADSIQEGVMALAKAIEKFEVERLNSFSTYAWHWICNGIQRFLVRNLFPLRFPDYLFDDYMRFLRELRKCVEPGDEAGCRARWHGLDRRLYVRMMLIHAAVHPLALPDADARSHPKVFDVLQQGELELTAICHEAVHSLKRRDRAIISMRYGLFGGRAMTLAEIGHKLKLTRERIRQLQVEAEARLGILLKRLRHLILSESGQDEDSEIAGE